MATLRCPHCGRVVPGNPRIKNQTHCKREACQRERKRLWQRQKMATDPDYKANQKECSKAWREQNPGYWKKYRESHLEAVERNRLRQRERNMARIAKMDASGPDSEVMPGTYYLVPEGLPLIAKMDASIRKITLLLMPYGALPSALRMIAKEDSMDSLACGP